MAVLVIVGVAMAPIVDRGRHRLHLEQDEGDRPRDKSK